MPPTITRQYLSNSTNAQSLAACGHSRVQAVRAAHADLKPAVLSWSEGELLGASINRSPTAYAANPAAERARYKYNVDKNMTVLRIHALSADGRQAAK